MVGFCINGTKHSRIRLSGKYLYVHQVLEGTAKVSNSETSHTLVEDGFLIQNVGTQHEVAVTDSPVLTIALHPSMLPGQRFVECLTPRDFEIDRAVSRLLRPVFSESDLRLTPKAVELSSALVNARDRSSQNYHLVEPLPEQKELALVMKSAREFILAHLSTPLLLSQVADCVAFSEFHFHRMFRQWHGVTPGDYIVKERIRRACRKLVLTEESVSDVAGACGFLSPTSFTRAFSNVTGLTPSEFRNQKRHFRQELLSFVTPLQSC